MVRVRFAPSPTGHLHIGGLRGALFNYIFAKQNGGKFLLRVEDTDFERNKDEFTQGIINAFKWCKIESDEPLVFQSKRNDIYADYLNQLILSGYAYYSDDPDENGIVSAVVKCKIDKSKKHFFFKDLIRGDMEFLRDEFDDFIIARSDGSFLYNFVVVVDDIEMGITHVIRGEEHLTNTPRQIAIYEGLRKAHPRFAHLPLILGSDGKKLSKRDAATAVIDYKAMGFLPEALCMYLIRLGWAYGDQEIFSYDELLKYFNIDTVHRAGAMFDFKKLCSVNSYYLKKMTVGDLYDYFENHKEQNFSKKILELSQKVSKDALLKLINLYKDRCDTLVNLVDYVCNLFQEKRKFFLTLEAEEGVKLLDEHSFVLDRFVKEFDGFDFLLSEEIKKIYEKIASDSNVSVAVLYKISRMALLDSFNSPSVCVLIEAVGIKDFVGKLNNLMTIYVSNIKKCDLYEKKN